MPETTPPEPDFHFDGQDAFEALSAALADAVLIVDAGGAVRYVGPGLVDVLGLDPDEALGRPFLDLVHPDDAVQHEGRPFWAAPPPFEREVRMRNGRGGWAWVRVQSSRIRPDGAVPEAVARVVGDGTLLFLRDRFEGTVRDASDLIQRAFDAVNNLVVVADARLPDTPLVVVNQNFLETTGYERHEVVGQNCRFLQTRADGTRDDDDDGQAEALDKVRTAVGRGGSTDVVLRNYRKDGTLFYNRLYISPVRDAAGEVTHFVGVQNDVTGEVEQAEAAGVHRGLLASFFDSAPFLMGVVELVDGGLQLRAANTAAVGLFQSEGATFDTFEGRALTEVGFTEEEAGIWFDHVREAAASVGPVHFDTTFPWGSDPEGKGVRALAVVVNRADGREPLFSYVAEDVTEIRRTSRERRLLAAAIESAAESILVTDATLDAPGPHILYANAAHRRIFGYDLDEVIGQSPRMFQGPATDRAVLDRIRRRLKAGEPVQAETVNYRQDGTPFVLEWEIAPVRDEGGQIVQWVGTQRDVTERRNLEREILEVASNEQERIAQDLHDGLGQVLTGATFKLQTLQNALRRGGNDALAADAERAQEMIEQALGQARAVARGLFPIDVESDGLEAALRRLAEDASEAFGVDCRFVSVGSAQVEPRERAGHLYRIAQEALANAARHGRASAVTITLAHEDGAGVTLTVEDDGVGIADGALERGGGLGMRTMAYRARRVGGALDVRALDDGGTAVSVRLESAPPGPSAA
ncbi:PAS domain S-box protein [Rubrivirga sp. S365]|uniref:PAS domain S-box protein n=1 Tax=Rubrivirga litoralis TaxID=3075598 RepID=A0ABU3BR26_9BACT|nr:MULTISPECIES: PAS domain S-box protein [unclassified Rubrivirga]MDT0631735.1 PAS domain S-box protein [Rubrivirga sp. F394]MDT7856101.1 PAS domain S-box protein [Rubrivirga sp. S365]